VKNGFIWKIPRGKEIEYGIISTPKLAKPFFNEFLKKNNLRLERIQSSVVPQGLIISSHPQITLCGDAAGLTKPWSGGGVIWGLIAASFLLKNFPDFLKYQKELKKFFLLRIIFSKFATKMVYLFGFNFPWLFPKNIKIEGDFLK
jgi:flavin-dependent dehydrogenase